MNAPITLRQRALARALRAAVDEADLTATELGTLADLDPGLLNKILTGQQRRTVDQYLALVKLVSGRSNPHSPVMSDLQLAVEVLCDRLGDDHWLAVTQADRAQQLDALGIEIVNAESVVMLWPYVVASFVPGLDLPSLGPDELAHVRILAGEPAAANPQTRTVIQEMTSKGARADVVPIELVHHYWLHSSVVATKTITGQLLIYTDTPAGGLFLHRVQDTGDAVTTVNRVCDELASSAETVDLWPPA